MPEHEARRIEMLAELEARVQALDAAAADTEPYGSWDAAKWAVFNAVVRLVKEAALTSEAPKEIAAWDGGADWPDQFARWWVCRKCHRAYASPTTGKPPAHCVCFDEHAIRVITTDALTSADATSRPQPTCPLCQRPVACTGWINVPTNSIWRCEVCEKNIEISPYEAPPAFVSSEERVSLVQPVSEVDSAGRVVAADSLPPAVAVEIARQANDLKTQLNLLTIRTEPLEAQIARLTAERDELRALLAMAAHQ